MHAHFVSLIGDMDKSKGRGGWREARKHKHGQARKGSLEIGEKRGARVDVSAIMTFFVTEFDEKWEARDLYHEFKDLGNIDEIFIPNNKTTWGKNYGFVRFFSVGKEVWICYVLIA